MASRGIPPVTTCSDVRACQECIPHDDAAASALLREQFCDAIRLDKAAQQRGQVADALDTIVATYYTECADLASVDTLRTALSRLEQRVHAVCSDVTCDAHGEVMALLVAMAVDHLVHIDVVERRRQAAVPFVFSSVSHSSSALSNSSKGAMLKQPMSGGSPAHTMYDITTGATRTNDKEDDHSNTASVNIDIAPSSKPKHRVPAASISAPFPPPPTPRMQSTSSPRCRCVGKRHSISSRTCEPSTAVATIHHTHTAHQMPAT